MGDGVGGAAGVGDRTANAVSNGRGVNSIASLAAAVAEAAWEGIGVSRPALAIGVTHPIAANANRSAIAPVGNDRLKNEFIIKFVSSYET